MRRTKTAWRVALLSCASASCSLFPGPAVDDSITRYEAAARGIQIGDSEDVVLGRLDPTQANLPPSARKSPDSFTVDGSHFDIHYFRTVHIPDGLTTDDEFTPYLFRDGKLMAIGWAALGGPKSTGQSLFPDFSTPQPPVKVGEGSGATAESNPAPRTPGNNLECGRAVASGDQGAIKSACD
jgi:hypothetical protein